MLIFGIVTLQENKEFKLNVFDPIKVFRFHPSLVPNLHFRKWKLHEVQKWCFSF